MITDNTDNRRTSQTHRAGIRGCAHVHTRSVCQELVANDFDVRTSTLLSSHAVDDQVYVLHTIHAPIHRVMLGLRHSLAYAVRSRAMND